MRLAMACAKLARVEAGARPQGAGNPSLVSRDGSYTNCLQEFQSGLGLSGRLPLGLEWVDDQLPAIPTN